jgi:hypothetical protein
MRRALMTPRSRGDGPYDDLGSVLRERAPRFKEGCRRLQPCRGGMTGAEWLRAADVCSPVEIRLWESAHADSRGRRGDEAPSGCGIKGTTSAFEAWIAAWSLSELETDSHRGRSSCSSNLSGSLTEPKLNEWSPKSNGASQR